MQLSIEQTCNNVHPPSLPNRSVILQIYILAQVPSYALAHVIAQFLESGHHSREAWRGFGDQIIAHPEFKEKMVAGDANVAVEEFGELFMGAWVMDAQDGFAYAMENITPEKCPNLFASLSMHTQNATKSSLKV